VAVGEQRVAQGEIDNFHVCVRVVVGDAILGVLNKGVIFAGKRRIKQTSLELLHLLMQHPPCSDKAMQSLEAFFRSLQQLANIKINPVWLGHNPGL
jgi:hypothetical protein